MNVLGETSAVMDTPWKATRVLQSLPVPQRGISALIPVRASPSAAHLSFQSIIKAEHLGQHSQKSLGNSIMEKTSHSLEARQMPLFITCLLQRVKPTAAAGLGLG